MSTLLIYENPEVIVRVYHNANSACYCGDHADIVLPDSPTAAVTITGEVEVEPVLARSYALTQHVGGRCAGNPGRPSFCDRDDRVSTLYRAGKSDPTAMPCRVATGEARRPCRQ
jgi:hypothetical protein